MHEPMPSSTRPGFWHGYLQWLSHHRAKLVLVGVTLALLFGALLLASRTPQDPFTYELY